MPPKPKTPKEEKEKELRVTQTPIPQQPITPVRKASPSTASAAVNQSPINQDFLNRALAKGINVFEPRNLRIISQAEQAFSENLAAGEAAAQGILDSTKETTEEGELTQEEQLQEDLTPAGLLGAEAVIEGSVAVAPLTSPLNIITGVDFIEEGHRELTRFAVKAFNKLPFVGGTAKRIIDTSKQNIIDNREMSSEIVTQVREGDLSPEQGLIELQILQDTISANQAVAHRASKLSLTAYLEGMSEVEQKLLKAQNQLNGDIQQVLRIAATGAQTNVQQTPDQILSQLR